MTVYKQAPVPEWTLQLSMGGSEQHSMLYRDETLKAQMEIHTPVRDGAPSGEGSASFHLDGDEREFATQQDMILAIIEGLAELWVHKGTTRTANN